MIAGNPIMAGGKKPSGSVNITANGTFDVTEKASAVVNVPNPSTGSLSITKNGTFDVTEKASAVVNVPNPSTGSLAITANGTYDVTTKARAVVNVNSAPVLLWTNASPTSSFASQTINVDTGYEGYLVEVRCNNSNTSIRGVSFFPVNYSNYGYVSVWGNGSGWIFNFRRIEQVSQGAIKFKDGGKSSGTGWSSNDTLAIPTRIWGVNFTL